MSTFTKEQLIEKLQHRISVASGFPESEKAQMDLELARIALASLEAEPAIHRWRRVTAEPYGPYPWHYGNFICFSKPVDGIEDEYYYAAPPAPVSVPDERYQHLSELYHAQEKRLFKLAQRIKGASFDKYAYSPSQAIDVLESAIFGEREDECRAAMLQGADGTLTNEGTIPVTQFNPVADLYGLTSPTGGETSFTFDAVEARDFIDGGWSCQEYVELERFQEAITNHTEDKLAMVDHSGDSNNMVEPVTTACKLRDAVDTIRNSGIAIDGEKILAERDALNSPVIPDGWVMVPEEPTHEMLEAGDEQFGTYDVYRRMIEAAPKLE
ncbi:hypothetical protein KGY91_19920 [Enterobacter hormaechei]|uniref:hypothetical protein n=1 Tax=Enterobacter hormaechei TaxID=158836 RepID=UPI0020928CD9|nr:hypothetical protein [Enterobacter hormaechei]MCO6599223.1 hypothetical protein [Enterobacter hormaechei]MCO6610981.1 hypothetical protein [Enterobacter hormaechei]MCO6623493.1 hypothetical protein [Enterobacter hormaechei]MCO6627739.1 hypothetical protein [Enterobacter hormaechei]MCO6638853.1 hypothetical protein [Enterobacter hormaechei]